MHQFEDPEVWRLARRLCQEIYLLAFEETATKDFHCKDQIRGTCDAVMENIAEGFGRACTPIPSPLQGEEGKRSYTEVWTYAIFQKYFSGNAIPMQAYPSKNWRLDQLLNFLGYRARKETGA